MRSKPANRVSLQYDRRRGLRWSPLLASLLFSASTSVSVSTFADPFTQVGPSYQYLSNTSSSSFASANAGLFQTIGDTGVVPNGLNGTTASAVHQLPGGGFSAPVTVFFVGQNTSPNEFTRSVPVRDFSNLNVLPWTLTFVNGTDTTSISTLGIAGAAVVPFATNVAISGTSHPSFSWTPPPGIDAVRINVWDVTNLAPSGSANVIYSQSTFVSLSSFTYPSSAPALQPGVHYSFEVSMLDLRSGSTTLGNENILSRARGFYDFQVLDTAVPGPIYLPTVGYSSTGAPFFDFNITGVSNQLTYIDPMIATGYEYETGVGDPNFASVLLPTGIGDNLFDLLLWNGSSFVDSGIDLMGGVQYFFGAGGVDRFEIGGIEISAGLDSANPTAFVTGLTFVSQGDFTGRMTPISVQIPEPETLALLALGFAGLALFRQIHETPNKNAS